MKQQTYCIYKLTNTINGKGYIGFTKDFKKRMWGHVNTANKGKGQAIHAAIRKYGWENFIKEEIYYSIDKQHTLDMEDVFINLHETKGAKGYNVTRGGQQGPPKGYVRKPMTEEQLIRLRERMKDPEIRRKISEGTKGNKNKLGWIASEETRKKQSNSLKGHTGRQYSLKERNYRSEVMKNNQYAKGHFHNDDWKEKARQRMLGRALRLGRKNTSESKQKMSLTMSTMWETKSKQFEIDFCCAVCNQLFIKKKWETVRRIPRFCSQSCYQKSRSVV